MTKHLPVALVVDDEIQIRRFLRAGFELEGFAVLEAETGAAGLRAATLKPIDVVIVDLGCRTWMAPTWLSASAPGRPFP